MEAIWLRSYQEGIPTTIDPDQYSDMNAFFAEVLNKYKELPAYTNMGKVITYAELDAYSKAFAAYLQHEFKIKKGDRFAIMLPNIIQYPIALLGALRAGATVVNINPLYTAKEVEFLLQDAEPAGVLILENFAHTLQEAIKTASVPNIMVTRIADVFSGLKYCLADSIVKYVKRMVPKWHIENVHWYKEVLNKGAAFQYQAPQMNSSDLAFLQYTGGTTGRAKGAMLTHRNMIANILQGGTWISEMAVPGKEIVVTPLPLYHIFSLTANCFIMMSFGALNVLITNPRDTKSFIKDLKKFPFTIITGVNTLFNLLLNQDEFAKVDFSAIKLVLGSGMAVQKAVADRWQAITGTPIIEAYGLTEASPAVCVNPLSLKRYNGTVGLPICSTEVSVRDENGNELNVDDVGELWIRGPQVMQGYWQNETDTAKALTDDGWLRSGDIVSIDKEGFIHVVDRLKDMIIVSGFNVYPNEIEDVIATHPGVSEVAVIGVSDPVAGEIVKAFVVRRDIKLSSEDLRQFCAEKLTAYKVPKQVEFREELPKSNVGKILRRALR